MFRTLKEINSYLDKIPQFGRSGIKAANFDLDRFRSFCQLIGSPHDDLRCIHVAGTNGKGSTCRLLASIYQENGYTTGLFTSPHLIDFRERFRINSRMIDEEEILDFFRSNQHTITNHECTYFELSTALAFWWFTKRNVDLAIIETGLGGRLDATNVISPLLSVITTIALDHTDMLGPDLKSIAREKSGIIKSAVPVVTGKIPPVALSEILKAAQKNDTNVYNTNALEYELSDDTLLLNDRNSGNTISLLIGENRITTVEAENMLVAWKSVQILSDQLPATLKKIEKGLLKTKSRFPRTGQFEKLLPENNWYFDGAHNVEAVRALKSSIISIKPVHEVLLVLALMRDKISPEIMKEFSEFKKIFYHTINVDRAATYSEVLKWLPDAVPVPVNVSERDHFLKEIAQELVIFTGSFYFYSVVRDWMQNYSNP